MGLNATPSAERLHIGFFGARNAGKSSVVNAVTGQQMSVVSEVKGDDHRPGYQINGAAAAGAGRHHRHPRVRRPGGTGGIAGSSAPGRS